MALKKICSRAAVAAHPAGNRALWASGFILILAVLLSGCAGSHTSPLSGDMTGGSAIVGSGGPDMDYGGRTVSTIRAERVDQGILLPGNGQKAVWIPGGDPQGMPPGYADAREIKLKVRELAEQLVSCVEESGLRGTVALPVSFVNMDNLEETSSFGRYIAEQMFHEFNQRGFPVREYRNRGNTIAQRNDQGEFYLDRPTRNVAVGKNGLIVAGTYYSDQESIFVNARIIRPSDGMVLRTGQLVLQNTGVTRRMLARSGNSAARAAMGIKDLNAPKAPAIAQTPFDLGEDIH